LLAILDAHELAVGELAATLQAPQSTVSRHLKRLLASGWITRRSVGPQALYRRAPLDTSPAMKRLWAIAADSLRHDASHQEDLRRVAEILSQRRVDTHAFFDAVADDWAAMRQRLFGQAVEVAWLPALLDPRAVVADLGCGTGSLTAVLAPWVKRVEAVDRESAMLDAARARLREIDNVIFREEDLLTSSIPAGSVDLAILSLVLHHSPSPDAAVSQAAHLLKPGGRMLIMDMMLHDRAEYRDTMGHVHLGFSESEVIGWMSTAGLEGASYRPLRPDPDAEGPGLFAATAHASR